MKQNLTRFPFSLGLYENNLVDPWSSVLHFPNLEMYALCLCDSIWSHPFSSRLSGRSNQLREVPHEIGELTSLSW